MDLDGPPKEVEWMFGMNVWSSSAEYLYMKRQDSTKLCKTNLEKFLRGFNLRLRVISAKFISRIIFLRMATKFLNLTLFHSH